MLPQKLDQQAVREAVFKAFHSGHESPSNYDRLNYAVNQILRQRGFSEQVGVHDRDQVPLTGRAETLLREIAWELITQGILVPSYNGNNYGWPTLNLTEYGRQVVEESRLTPADPDGFLDQLQKVYPGLSDTIVHVGLNKAVV